MTHANLRGWSVSFEHFFKLNVVPSIFKDRFYISGYMDHNIDYGGATKATGDNHYIVTETQAGYRLVGGLNAVGEFRLSQYAAKKYGAAFGLEYVVNF